MHSSRLTNQPKRKNTTTCVFVFGVGIALIVIFLLLGSSLTKCNPRQQLPPTLSPLLLSSVSTTPSFGPTYTNIPVVTLSKTIIPTILNETGNEIIQIAPSLNPEETIELPSSGKIVFTCTPGFYNQLCIMNADGSGYTRLTNHMANDYYPSLTRDGQEILFASNRSSVFEVYNITLDGGYLRQLTNQIGNVSAPELSPSGNQVVFASKINGNTSIWLIDKDGGNPYPISDSQWNEIDPTWSPDGQSIAFASVRGGYVELFTMLINGKEIQQVTSGVYGIGGRSSWSPDGKKLVFYAGPQKDRDIYTVEISTGIIERLTHGGNNTGPCYSPDGQWIVFSSSRDSDHEIFIMRSDGTQVTQLTWNNYDDWQPRWGP